MVITDNNIIDRAIPLCPDMMSDKAEDIIKAKFYELKKKQSELSQLRMQASELEKEVKVLQEEYKSQSSLFEITFAKKEIEDIKQECYMGVINHSDYRNKH